MTEKQSRVVQAKATISILPKRKKEKSRLCAFLKAALFVCFPLFLSSDCGDHWFHMHVKRQVTMSVVLKMQVPLWSCSATTRGTRWWKRQRPTKTATSTSKLLRASPPMGPTSARSFWSLHHLPRVRNPPTSTVALLGLPLSLRSPSCPSSYHFSSTLLGLSLSSPNAKLTNKPKKQKMRINFYF